jgi:hypothetical protein
MIQSASDGPVHVHVTVKKPSWLRGCFLLLLSLIMLIPLHELQAQERVLVRGQVMNARTQEPLPYVHVIRNDTIGIITGLEGKFTIAAHPGDTLMISHLGYRQDTVTYKSLETDSSRKTIIALESQSYPISRVVVRPYNTYGEFRQAFLNLNPYEPDKMKGYANRNVKQIQKPPSHPEKEPAHILQYKNPVDGPPVVTFISTDPEKGIIGFLREITGKKKPSTR